MRRNFQYRERSPSHPNMTTPLGQASKRRKNDVKSTIAKHLDAKHLVVCGALVLLLFLVLRSRSPTPASPSSLSPARRGPNPEEKVGVEVTAAQNSMHNLNQNIKEQDEPQLLVANKLASFPHDTECFSQGLEFHKGILYESCGLYKASSIRTVNFETGEVLKDVPLADHLFAEGLTIMNEKVYIITWREHKGFVYSLDLELLEEFAITTDGWGRSVVRGVVWV